MKPPVVLVSNSRLPSRRANSLQVMQTAAAFARAGRATTLMHARRYTPPAERIEEDPFEYYALTGAAPSLVQVPCLDWIDRVPARLQYVPARIQELSFARRAARALARDHRGAHVLSRELEIARHLARISHPSLFMEVHRVPGGQLRRRWLLEASRACRGVLAISGGVGEDLERLGVDPKLLRVEHDAFDPGRFAGAPARDAARRELGVESDGPLVVYTGGLLEWKGVGLLVEAARLLPEVDFLIAGGQPRDVERLRAQARGLTNVRIDGFQPPGRMGLYLAAGDLGVVPNRSTPAISARYTSPLKVFEAMGAGLPLVVSDLPSLREILGQGEGALFVEPDDARALAEGITTLVRDADLRGRLGRAMGARAAGHDWDSRAHRILDWMDSPAPGRAR